MISLEVFVEGYLEDGKFARFLLVGT